MDVKLTDSGHCLPARSVAAGDNHDYTGPCLLRQLQPIRHCLHPFLSSSDAARVMCTSRATTTALLTDYRFLDHVFFAHASSTSADLKRSLALYAHYRMRITRMCPPADVIQELADGRGEPILPRSLVALTLGRQFARKSIAYANFVGEHHWEEEKEEGDAETQRSRMLQRWEDEDVCSTWQLHKYGNTGGVFNLPIPPGALPHGLRFLQLSNHYNHPLQPGSIPDTVEVLQFGHDFNHPLAVGHLPASLTHLTFGALYNQMLLSGVLPAGLRRLHLRGSYNHQLLPAILPTHLQQLDLGCYCHRVILPGVIPASVTHLCLGNIFNHPLQPGSIPHGVTHLNLGDRFDQPLLPGMLPSSMRELVLGEYFDQPLQPGSLPDGLEMLVFHMSSQYDQILHPGIIPASVVVVSLGRRYRQQLVVGGIPATVRWLRLPEDDVNEDLSSVLTSSTRVVYWAGTTI